ncbi:hypothetical protein GCM10023196_064830 [Actinoallomurus vinaceus]|uniref:Uncharacterized protein n=1 Tax=Actinoallomurus vinaceus TaxID=1080074 RepID=A0ABP8UKL4_9ACTN
MLGETPAWRATSEIFTKVPLLSKRFDCRDVKPVTNGAQWVVTGTKPESGSAPTAFRALHIPIDLVEAAKTPGARERPGRNASRAPTGVSASCR